MTQSLAEMLSAVDVVDLTQPLSEDTPVLKLPPPFANTPGLTRHEISRYDDRGPAWAWYWLEIGEHVGTHFDAPIHWVSGKDGEDVASVPPQRLVGPAVVIDKSAEAAEDPDFCYRRPHPRVRGRARAAAGGRLAAASAPAGTPAPTTRRRSSTPTRPARTRRASTSSAPAGSPRRARSSASASRRSAPTRAPRTPSTRRSRCTLRARRRQVRPHPARQPRAAAADRRGGDRRAAEAGGRHGQPRARARARPAPLTQTRVTAVGLMRKPLPDAAVQLHASRGRCRRTGRP